MKTAVLLLLSLAALFFNNAEAQKIVNKYCRVTVSETKHNLESIDIDYGKNETFNTVKDTGVIIKLEKVKTFTNIVDALNYLSSMGWEYINTVSPVKGYFHDYNYMYIFKKSFAVKD